MPHVTADVPVHNMHTYGSPFPFHPLSHLKGSEEHFFVLFQLRGLNFPPRTLAHPTSQISTTAEKHYLSDQEPTYYNVQLPALPLVSYRASTYPAKPALALHCPLFHLTFPSQAWWYMPVTSTLRRQR